ncbi:MAG: alpha-L-fucosidase [Planctomycetota bacterium]
MSEASSMVETPTPYEATWTSLRRHHTPQWLMDAKFGVYSHWGIRTIQHLPGCESLSDAEALARFTAPAFDPAAWASLFREAGARFAGPIGWHGSPLLHWDSRLNDYNTVKNPPHRDIVGEVTAAVREQGLKTLVSFHTIDDNGWLPLAQEVVDRYAPDIVWVDASFGGTKQCHHLGLVEGSRYTGTLKREQRDQNPGHHPADYIQQLDDRYQRRFISHFYNAAIANGREVEFVYKSHDIPPGIGMRDLENGLLPETGYDAWMTDIDLHVPPDWNHEGWFDTPGMPLRSVADVVHRLVDVVSKNGVLLLNAPPTADGAFGDDVAGTLREIGAWLNTFGEAIYDASPWYLYGEGPTLIDDWNKTFHHNDHFNQNRFTAEDIRFTMRGDTLFATTLGRPSERVLVKALGTGYRFREGRVQSVRLLGQADPLSWSHRSDGLAIELPDRLPLNDAANVFEIVLAS